jgi:hypothetical protein
MDQEAVFTYGHDIEVVRVLYNRLGVRPPQSLGAGVPEQEA